MRIITIDGCDGIWVPIKKGTTEREVLVACGWTDSGHPGVRRSNEEVTQSWGESAQPPFCDLEKLVEINGSIAAYRLGFRK